MTIDQNPIASAGDHLEVVDALYRFGAGVDHNDSALIASAFSEDIVVDFGPCGRKMDLKFPLLTGHETVVGFLSANAGSQTTSHVITNGRVHVEGDVARLRILVDATHLPQGDHSRRCQMMNWYEVELIRDERLWRIRRLVIDNAWFTGDPQVLLGK
jgi:SnoaL-like domain